MARFRISNVARRPALAAVLRYGLAFASVAAALGLSLILVHYGLPRLFGGFSLVAIAIAFWYGGTGPGLLAVLLSSLAFYFFLFPVTEVRGPGWQSFLVVYTVFAGLAGWFSASRRRAERLLAEARDSLEKRVAERTSELARANEELKSTENALRQSEDHLRLVIDTVPALIHTGRPDGYLDYFNRRWLDYVGLPLEEVAGWKWTEVNHPDDVVATVEKWRRSIATGKPFEHESRLRRADGEYRWMLHRKVPLRDERGNIVKWYGSSVDIEDRKRAEEALRKSEERWRSVFENSAIGVALTDLSGHFLAANPVYQRMVGYKEEELRRLSFLDITQKEYRQANWALIGELLEGKREQFQIEKQYRRKDGSLVRVRNNVSLVPGTESVPRFIMALSEDITERKEAEEALRDSEERFRTTFENAGVAMALVDMQGHPIKSNPALRQMLGYSEEELSRMAFTEFTHSDDRELDWRLYGELTAGKRDKYEIEKRYLKKGGDVVWGLLTVSLVKGRHTHPVYAVGMVQDITERKQAEKELEHSFGQLRALAARLQGIREEERTRVAREIHDELGQALTAIKIAVTALLRSVPPDKEAKAQRGESVLKLLDEVIQSVRRIATELRPVVLDELGLVAAVEWASEEFQARTGIKCRISLPDADIAIDPECATALFRIFQETLTNVARHANATRVNVRLTKEDGNLTLQVHDNGKGISEEQLSAASSLGILGMRERASLLGGELTITGAPGKGTTAIARIPEIRPALAKEHV
jgi:PAS domain S-box-containing protein